LSCVFQPLTVQGTHEEIGAFAKTVEFDVPPNLAETYAWRAGQHLSFRFEIDGQEVRRSYSISSSPVSGDPLRITVKRVKGGLISNHINDTIEEGDVIDVMPPFGSFCLDTAQNKRRTHYFFGAGSGITPLYSMLHSVLCDEPYSVAYLIYGNKNKNSILFNERLNSLIDHYGDRISVRHVLSDPSTFTSFGYWRKGLVDKAAIEAFISEHPPYAQDAQYYICGPGGMNQSVRTALMLLDVPGNRIHMESYGGVAKVDDTVKGIAADATIQLDDTMQDVSVAANQTVLEAVRNAGLNPPYSCQSGVCGACRATLNDGTVHMRARMALEDSEIEQGAILTCQAVPRSKKISLTYDL